MVAPLKRSDWKAIIDQSECPSTFPSTWMNASPRLPKSCPGQAHLVP